ncbi:hypothetical protein Osc7112_2727 [Oscillatoria nigro-viridis PCC 7112]|uniref:Uncharacterized protein n=1 Tax=Phormidium nigroviride PCC 7112 TaxID=179408 RepID=K9VI23_9CYAN|nr:hypothetical protein Osc7112_2727 [Oscillatoria nigro-viridis PCC 7112]
MQVRSQPLGLRVILPAAILDKSCLFDCSDKLRNETQTSSNSLPHSSSLPLLICLQVDRINVTT